MVEGLTYTRAMVGLIAGAFDLTVGLLLFIYTQIKVHGLINAYKQSMVNLLQALLEGTAHRYLAVKKSIRQTLGIDIQFLRRVLDYHENLKVWPYTTTILIKVASFSLVIFQSVLMDMF